MTTRTQAALAIVGAVGSAVTAGVYANFSVRVMPLLSRLADTEGILKMQAFNRVAVRSPFMVCFFGAALVGGYFVVRVMRGNHSRVDVLAAVGGGLYLLSFLITVVYNVPLNDKLAAVDAASAAAVPVWRDFISGWTSANTVRAVFSTLGTVCLLGAAWVGLRDGAATPETTSPAVIYSAPAPGVHR